MTHRNVIRLFSGTMLAAFALGCGNDSPTDSGPFLEVSPINPGVLEGTTLQLAAKVGTDVVPVTWSSTNTAVATVSASGVVTGITAGRAAVTAALTSDPTKLSSSSITVIFVQTLVSGTGVAAASSGARGSTNLYKIVVPAGTTNLSVTLAGGSGDADVYMRQGTPPTVTSYTLTSSTCASENGGNGELCDIPSPTPGTWFIAVAVWDAYAGATLTPVITP
jgi:serine protease